MSLTELALNQVEPVLFALNALLHSRLGSTQIFAGKASLMHRIKVLLANFKLARCRSSEYDLADERRTSLAQSLPPSLFQYCSETHEYSLCYKELKVKEQLEELRRKIVRLESRRTELERKMEAIYASSEKISHELIKISMSASVLERKRRGRLNTFHARVGNRRILGRRFGNCLCRPIEA